MKMVKRCTGTKKRRVRQKRQVIAMAKGRVYEDLYARLKTKEGEKKLFLQIG